ncbi:MAG: SRPBCC family protein [Kofleriaceae bacterium]|nr:SRPBCC family protein [Kofleriaceae bacterium]
MAIQHNEIGVVEVEAFELQPPPIVQVSYLLSSRPERVFDTFLDPMQIQPWLHRGVGEVKRLVLEPYVGGSLVVVARRSDGSFLDGYGTIRELERPTRIAFTWEAPKTDFPESLVTVDIAERPDRGSSLVLTHVLDPRCADATARVEATWRAVLDALVETLGYPACDDPSIDEPT